MNHPARTERSFPRTALYIAAGLLIWAANFLITYIFAALACARGFAGSSLGALGVMPLGATLVCLLSLAAAGLVLRHAIAGYREQVRAGQRSGTGAFIHFIAAIGAALSIVAVVWSTFAALLPVRCGP